MWCSPELAVYVIEKEYCGVVGGSELEAARLGGDATRRAAVWHRRTYPSNANSKNNATQWTPLPVKTQRTVAEGRSRPVLALSRSLARAAGAYSGQRYTAPRPATTMLDSHPVRPATHPCAHSYALYLHCISQTSSDKRCPRAGLRWMLVFRRRRNGDGSRESHLQSCAR